MVNGDSLSAAYLQAACNGSMQKKFCVTEKLSSKSKRWIRDICPSTPVQDFVLVYVVVEVCSIAPEHS